MQLFVVSITLNSTLNTNNDMLIYMSSMLWLKWKAVNSIEMELSTKVTQKQVERDSETHFEVYPKKRDKLGGL